ncbi:DUF6879 family protein [Actinomadura gamaensis]|uniref:DUF6879 family protein n=1 Tax=Actinomadura gamaensis TaxID=1763541 RepID=A0ABV9TRP4_9ACTN
MRTRPAPPFGELIAATERSAVHLELRDAYTPEDPAFRRWLAGESVNVVEAEREWFDIVRDATARGVSMRRIRVVSEPLAPYPAFEHECTHALNITAGEQVRWLPRKHTGDLLLPGLDYWLFDDHTVRFHHFAGDGTWLYDEVTNDREAIERCAASFAAAWDRAMPHEEYHPA